MPPSQFLGLINDGLVTLDHAAGPDGTRLVPDLALALPPPSATAAPTRSTCARASGIRPARSSGPATSPAPSSACSSSAASGMSYYRAISGAAACLKSSPRPVTCPAASPPTTGPAPSPSTSTQPDPDFLYKLTLAYADVLPAADSRPPGPDPAAGHRPVPDQPLHYPARELLLVRNPRFREWSAAAQPAGTRTGSCIRLDLGPAQGAAAVARGEGDFMPNLGQIPSSTAYFQHHRSQLRINPQMITGFLFLNVNAPPFNDVRVRQAVNLALDRGLVVDHYGGPLAAQPTCQIMPPAWPATAATAPTPATPRPAVAGRHQT